MSELAARILQAKDKNAFEGDKARIELQLVFEQFKKNPSVKSLSPTKQMVEFIFAQQSATNARMNMLSDKFERLLKALRE